MAKKSEVNEIIAWCENKKREKNLTYIVEKNPFREKFKWTSNKIFIEIDRPKIMASKLSLVYDSTTKRLYEYLNGSWRFVPIDLEIE